MYGWQVMEQAAELERRGEPFALATVVWRQGPSSGQLGSRAIITTSGELLGWIGGACAEPSVIRQAREVITDGRPRLLLLGSPDELPSSARFSGSLPDGMTVVPISCQSEGALEVYVEPVLPVPHLVVVGRSPMAHALADLAAVIGWRAATLDWPEFSAADADERSIVVVATQGHGDEEAIERAIAARPSYIGLVASRKRGTAVLGYLAERGLPPDQLDRVRVPAGLDLGKTSHVEIAVAILAELVRLRAAGEIGFAGGAVGRAATAAAPAQASDPVCGMTVAAVPATVHGEHDGVTYYFCSAGCRSAFESDPVSYHRNESRC
ncbi:MAG TPA: XdhC family protein [Streptosporangiaceae bacterium]|nr:XdhC family protein [Streptosporangiaceae bacterium]